MPKMKSYIIVKLFNYFIWGNIIDFYRLVFKLNVSPNGFPNKRQVKLQILTLSSAMIVPFVGTG